MRLILRCAVIAAAALCSSLALADELTPVGTWTTIDDATGKAKSVVQITDIGGKLEGKVLEVLQSDDGPHPICKNCTGDRKDKPIEGMVIMWDVVKDGASWSGGRILDPKTGKVYKVSLTPSDGGAKLDVRGYIGFSLFGRTQTWQRKSP